jgi:hypothetical protein
MTENATQAWIEDAMARAQKVACRPGDDGCHPFPDLVEDIRASGPSTGRCRIAWILTTREAAGSTGRMTWL